MFDINFAFLGSVLLAACGLPEAIKCYKQKHCGIGWTMLWLWLIGELCVIVFALQSKQYILLINYIANLIFVLIMMRYK